MIENAESVALAAQLIGRPSVTPHDGGCQDIVAQRLQSCRFQVERLRFGQVDNMWATYSSLSPDKARGSKEHTLLFLGHTDVVAPGPSELWRFGDPFSGRIEDGWLYGRGAVDMKGAIGAYVVACERFARERPNTRLRLAIALTSCEESFTEDGIKRLSTWLDSAGEPCPYVLVGEPSSRNFLGDTVKKGRRGSLSAVAVVKGEPGHVAYASGEENIIHRATQALRDVITHKWNRGLPVFPPVTLHVTHIESGLGGSSQESGNMTAGTLVCRFNVRFPPNIEVDDIKRTVEDKFRRYLSASMQFECKWTLSGLPFLSREGLLAQTIRRALRHEVNFSTDGGTSDGRFLARPDREIMELGLPSERAHKTDERVLINDIVLLEEIYYRILSIMSRDLDNSEG